MVNPKLVDGVRHFQTLEGMRDGAHADHRHPHRARHPRHRLTGAASPGAERHATSTKPACRHREWSVGRITLNRSGWIRTQPSDVTEGERHEPHRDAAPHRLVLSVVVASIVLSGVGVVADMQSAATASDSRLARPRRAGTCAPLQVATLQASRVAALRLRLRQGGQLSSTVCAMCAATAWMRRRWRDSGCVEQPQLRFAFVERRRERGHVVDAAPGTAARCRHPGRGARRRTPLARCSGAARAPRAAGACAASAPTGARATLRRPRSTARSRDRWPAALSARAARAR